MMILTQYSLNIGRGIVWMKIEVLVLFFKRLKRLEGKYTPPPFFLQSSGKNFEMAISFTIVERPNNYGSGYNTITSRPWGKVF